MKEVPVGLVETYASVKDCVVAFGPIYHQAQQGEPPPLFPRIIGTGVLVGDGLVATNDHVIRACAQQWRPPDAPPDQWHAIAHIFKMLPSYGLAHAGIPIDGVYLIDEFKPGGHYYGPPKPDVGIVRLKAKGTPFVAIRGTEDYLQEGLEVATSGYPMGEAPIIAPAVTPISARHFSEDTHPRGGVDGADREEVGRAAGVHAGVQAGADRTGAAG